MYTSPVPLRRPAAFYLTLSSPVRVLPESPRWLLSRNRLDRCSKVLENIAAKNGRKVPESLQETLQAIVATQRSETNYGAVQLFKYRVMAIRTLLLTACL
uniref:Major facilitator superfamily (MFS) profile domain-containing protein n=1 Tax=Scylla olivacea TaxID=85551 RepID=A0A0P4WQ12_SCYOL